MSLGQIGAVMFGTFVGGALGNFSYAYLTKKDWHAAQRDTFFQAWALLAAFVGCALQQWWH